MDPKDKDILTSRKRITKMKCELYHFFPEVYPFNFWIYIGNDISGLIDNFNNDFNFVNNSGAVTISVPHGGCKTDPNMGFIIWFLRKNIIDFETVSHEVSHVSLRAFEYIEEEIKNSEPFCYLSGWLAKKCGQVKNGVDVKHNLIWSNEQTRSKKEV